MRIFGRRGEAMKTFTWIVLFFFVFQSSALSAEFCQTTGTTIYFGNGMFNSMTDVQNSMIELERLDLSQITRDPNRLHYKMALNLSESDLNNILAVVEQRTQGDLSYFWEVLDGVLPVPEWLNDPIEHALASQIHDDTLAQMVSDYTLDLESGSKVILVSHSQGNFYAEESEKELLENYHQIETHSFGFGNVRVATPTRTRFSYPYFTFGDDYFMNLVRSILGAPFANLLTGGSDAGPTFDPNGHDFVRAYLANTESREKIRQAILSEAQATASPCLNN
jgi:hypothetical protein